MAGERVGAFPGALFPIVATGGDNIAAQVALFRAAALAVAAPYLGASGGLCLAALAVCRDGMLHAAIHRAGQPLSAALFIGSDVAMLVFSKPSALRFGSLSAALLSLRFER